MNWVRIDLEKEQLEHLIRPEDRLRVAMARQLMTIHGGEPRSGQSPRRALPSILRANEDYVPDRQE